METPAEFAKPFFRDADAHLASYLTTFGVVFCDDGTSPEDMFIEAGLASSRRDVREQKHNLAMYLVNDRVAFLARMKKGHLFSGRFCIVMRPGEGRPVTKFRRAA